jgi:GTP-binding protein
VNFKSSTNQAPRHAQQGAQATELDIELELKLIADIALVGLPNAGKSTLISSISAARPKIADYPFTTLEPNLGVVSFDEQSVVVADIPGLIEDASTGKGLGIKFLKHIERTSAFVHLVDCSWCLEPYEAFEQYVTVREELIKYSENLGLKKEIICLTKIDAMSDEELQTFQSHFQEQLDKKVLPISSVSGRNLDKLKQLMLKTLEVNQEKE